MLVSYVKGLKLPHDKYNIDSYYKETYYMEQNSPSRANRSLLNVPEPATVSYHDASESGPYS